MRSGIEVELHTVRGALPGWCDRFLAPPDGGDVFASRLWYDAILAHACPVGAEPVLARCGDALLLPMLRQGATWRAMVTPYSLEWRPLPGPETDHESLQRAGRAMARHLRHRPPTRLDAMDPTAPGMAAILAGLGQGMALARYAHFGNWRQALVRGAGWLSYLAGRPSTLRSTILRKLARAGREARFSFVTAPGAALEEAIVAYQTVRGKSWKPCEPFPDFDAAWARRAAAAGALRMGVLRGRDGTALAAQHWVLSGGHASLLKLAHDEAARAASPGTALTAMMIRYLIDEDGATTLDFGRGDDAYKQLWASERRPRIGVVLSDPWHPAGLLELGRQAAAKARDWVRA
jgi:hypothetical protein